MAYSKLVEHFRRLSHLEHIAAFIDWDESTMMPSGGGEARAEAIATLSALRHELATRAEIADLFADAEASTEPLDRWHAANQREMKRAWQRDNAVPQNLIAERALAQARCQQAWRSMRPQNDWQAFRPLLQRVVKLERERAQALADALGLDPYDALLDGYEPGGRRRQIDATFAELAAFLPDFTGRAVELSRARTVEPPIGPFPIDRQRELGIQFMSTVGFDFDHGRLDVSHHPFCGGVPSDVRMTTRYDENDFTKALMGILHETGHAKYEQHLPTAWRDQPVGAARSMSYHESQSLLMEMQVGRSRAFLEFAAPLMRTAFADSHTASPTAYDLDNLLSHYTRVEPGFIRVDADEVTYPSHIIVRYEIEKDLIDGAAKVAEIPERWNDAMTRLLGIETQGNDADGCMQDVHWTLGAIGYFPTYTLGAMRAAQLFAAAAADIAGLDDDIRRGDLSRLDEWLDEKLWSAGSIFEGEDLMRHATGAPLNADAFVSHLQRRYGERDG